MGPNTEMKENKPKDNGNKLYYKKKNGKYKFKHV